MGDTTLRCPDDIETVLCGYRPYYTDLGISEDELGVLAIMTDSDPLVVWDVVKFIEGTAKLMSKDCTYQYSPARFLYADEFKMKPFPRVLVPFAYETMEAYNLHFTLTFHPSGTDKPLQRGKSMDKIIPIEDLVDTTYETLDPHGFGWALKCLKNGLKVSRKGWNGKGMWLALQVPDEHSKMNRPYIYMKAVNDELVPWVASQTDLLADDWIISNKKEE